MKHHSTRVAALFLALVVCFAVRPLATAAQQSSGDALFAAGDFASARAEYARVLAARPGDVDANLGAARLELYSNNLQAALAFAQAAVANDRSNVTAAAVLAMIIGRQRAVVTGYHIEMPDAETIVPFVETDPLPIIPVVIDGQRAQLVLDTGAPGLALSATFAKKIGVRATGERKANFAGGRSAIVRTGARVTSLGIGTATVRDVPADIAPVPSPEIDGVLGTNVLFHFLATIDYERGRLILRPKSASASFENSAAAAGASIQPLYLIPDHFLFTRARVNEAPERMFGIDTGGAIIGIDLSDDALRAAHIVPNATGDVVLMGGGGEVNATTFTADSVSIGPTTVRSVPGISVKSVATHGPFPFAVAGRLSHLLFRHCDLSLDFEAMRVIVACRPAS